MVAARSCRLRHRLMSRWAAFLACAGVLLVASPVAAAPSPSASSGASPTATTTAAAPVLLSLGDSLAAGLSGRRITAQGYADQLTALLRPTMPGLTLVKLGCPGETSAAMVTGGLCAYPHGSQLLQAAWYLQSHRGQVAVVTLDIGANDIDRCASHGVIDRQCLAGGFAATRINLAVILAVLEQAAGGTTRFVAMNYYDPFLAAGVRGGAVGAAVAQASVPLSLQFNALLAGMYTTFRVAVADVAAAFMTTDTTPVVTGRGSLPRNLATVCQWTGACDSGDVHPNATGYGVIAEAFAARLRR